MSGPVVPIALKAGDALLYGPTGFFGWVISIKTWHQVAHCECYIGNGKSVASRDGVGVGQYDWRSDKLVYVLRPNVPFDLVEALAQFNNKWRGQGYDWAGLLRFGWRAPVKALRFDNKQFCSEFLTRWYRAGGIDPFNSEDADAVAPCQFLCSPVFDIYEVQTDGTIQKRTIQDGELSCQADRVVGGASTGSPSDCGSSGSTPGQG